MRVTEIERTRPLINVISMYLIDGIEEEVSFLLPGTKNGNGTDIWLIIAYIEMEMQQVKCNT
jgi:hypothetical protein